MSRCILEIKEAENGYVIEEYLKEEPRTSGEPVLYPGPKKHIASNIKDVLRLTKIILEGNMSEEQEYSEGFKEASR